VRKAAGGGLSAQWNVPPTLTRYVPARADALAYGHRGTETAAPAFPPRPGLPSSIFATTRKKFVNSSATPRKSTHFQRLATFCSVGRAWESRPLGR
jgi:hypothetical protein